MIDLAIFHPLQANQARNDCIGLKDANTTEMATFHVRIGSLGIFGAALGIFEVGNVHPWWLRWSDDKETPGSSRSSVGVRTDCQEPINLTAERTM